MSDRYRTTTNRISRSTARFKPLLSIPKYASGSIGRLSLEKQAAESVASGEEHKDHECDDQGHRPDHREHRRALVVHPVEASAASSSPTRYTDPVASTAQPCSRAHARAAASARCGRGSQSASSKPSW